MCRSASAPCLSVEFYHPSSPRSAFPLMPYKLQQLGLGGILDETIAVVKDHFGLLFKIMLFLLLPLGTINGYITATILPATTSLIPSPEQQAATNEAILRYWPYFLFAFIAGVIIMPATYAALIQAAAHAYLGRPITPIQCIKDGFKLIGPYIWTAILFYLAVFGGMLLLFIPGLIFGIWFSFSQYVLVIEGTGGTAALRRSRSLVRGHFGTLLVLGIVLY